MTTRIVTLIVTAAALCVLAACSGAKEQLGLTRSAPDEFAVVKRAPLAMPPDYTLRPPQPGAARPQEQNPSVQAQSALFGVTSQPVYDGVTRSEAALLQQAGAGIAQPDIRQLVDQETATMEPRNKPVAEKLLGIGGDDDPPATVVDAEAEAERLRRNAEEGKPVTAGETPSKDE